MRELGQAVVGTGTVTTLSDSDNALAAGAEFSVSPGLDLDIVRESENRGLPSLPGVATTTEVHTFLRAGFTWLKAFPARHLGLDWFRAMRGPFPDLIFITTGGVAVADVLPLLAVSVHTVALGSAPNNPDELDQLPSLVSAVQGNKSDNE